MDDKQNLSPDLKQIYDSIMNTPVKPGPTGNMSSTPLTSSPNGLNEASSPPPTSPSTPAMPPLSSPVEPPAASTFTPSTLNGVNPPSVSSSTPPLVNPLPSVEPKPINNSSSTPFVFSSNQNGKKTTPNKTSNTAPHVPRGTPKLLFLLIPLGIIFLAVYAVFWMALFGLVDLTQFGL